LRTCSRPTRWCSSSGPTESPAALPDNRLELVLHIADDDHREIEVRPHGPTWARRMDRLTAALEPFSWRPRQDAESTERT
jgi:hypothetical protein